MRETEQQKLVKGPLVLYEQMRLKILELIEERGLQPHDPVPSEGELADLYGVSRRTSKEALLALAKSGIVYRLPRRGTFLAQQQKQPNQQSSTVKQRITDGVDKRYLAMIVPVLDDYTGQIVSFALQKALSKQWDLIIRVSDGSMEKEANILKDLAADSSIGGILLFPGDRRMCGDQVLRLHLEKYPIVILDRTFREINIPSAYHDHYQGAYDITEYFIKMGHTQIGFVSAEWSGIMSREERYQGFIQAHLDYKLSFNPDCIYTDRESNNLQDEDISTEPQVETSLTLAAFLQKHREVTAIFCANDFVALKAMNTALQLGIKVPADLSLGGFTDFPFAELLEVPLTTIRKPPETVAEAAVHLLLERIENPDLNVTSIKLPTLLIERSSVLNRKL